MLKISYWETKWCLLVVFIGLISVINAVSKEGVEPSTFTIGTIAILIASFVIGYVVSAKIIMMQNGNLTKRQRDTNESIRKYIL